MSHYTHSREAERNESAGTNFPYRNCGKNLKHFPEDKGNPLCVLLCLNYAITSRIHYSHYLLVYEERELKEII